MNLIDVEIGQIRYRNVRVPTRFGERFRGLLDSTGPMLFDTNSVHGFGMSRSLMVVAISAEMRVLAVRTLRPWTAIYERGASWMLELELGQPVPAVGDRATTYDPVHDRTAGGVRDSDREPRGHLRASRPDPR